ncbi:ornithine carbamoyltransferase [Candidatus Protochlamydia sp. W-9]|uniref:ornithine carbamoyltransferase n=1 Tax=Candidatus Protochlamydia sp. W-9 TaxID=1785087 RepID=UPI000B302E22|nr:ornithine carbamoyltransferase [Candidatus Protochlamydia sp. W-9]
MIDLLREKYIMKNSLLTLNDLSTERFLKILDNIKIFKQNIIDGKSFKPLENKLIGILFNQPSTRTRTSFETAIIRLGGNSIHLSDLRLKRDELIHSTSSSNELDLRYVEPVKDTGRILSSYLDAIVIRTRDHGMIEDLAKYSSIPIINANSDLCHPTQIIADIYTVLEIKGKLSGLTLAYLGDGNNTCSSLLLGCAHAGINMIAACPEESYPNAENFKKAKNIAEKTGSNLKIIVSPEEAVKDADILYTDAWISMSAKQGKDELIKIFSKYQLNSRLLNLAKKNTLVMHCLPAHRGFEITDEVVEGPQSIVWKQAENKIYTAAAVLAELVP